MDKALIFVLCFYVCSAQIKIKRLDVPSAILYGSQNDVILDCDFDSGGDTVDEIKWFLDETIQIYQWLPETKTKAQAIGKLKNHIDVNYKATNDESTMYRALHITDLSPEFSGNYTCKVSGPTSEDVETKRMIIYVAPEDETPEDGFDEILDLNDNEDASEITCTAGGFYPKPNMTIYILNENETDIIFRQDNENHTLTEEGYYNVTSTLKYSNLTQDFVYICELVIPGTPFNVTQKLMHTEDGEAQVQEELYAFNTTNSTESSFEGTTASSKLRKFIIIVHLCCEESASFRLLPSLLSTLLPLALLVPLNL
ncbi:uncharacterized protein LOC135127722 isoform X2 [Zophobas morio]|uniref:uncharacterized protein LOC135127722 isoform X2 n=1 Tax=Zophobas morio TaxID=2755281 RepID=UPI003083AC81